MPLLNYLSFSGSLFFLRNSSLLCTQPREQNCLLFLSKGTRLCSFLSTSVCLLTHIHEHMALSDDHAQNMWIWRVNLDILLCIRIHMYSPLVFYLSHPLLENYTRVCVLYHMTVHTFPLNEYEILELLKFLEQQTNLYETMHSYLS